MESAGLFCRATGFLPACMHAVKRLEHRGPFPLQWIPGLPAPMRPVPFAAKERRGQSIFSCGALQQRMPGPVGPGPIPRLSSVRSFGPLDWKAGLLFFYTSLCFTIPPFLDVLCGGHLAP